jgi:hypothetical protein
MTTAASTVSSSNHHSQTVHHSTSNTISRVNWKGNRRSAGHWIAVCYESGRLIAVFASGLVQSHVESSPYPNPIPQRPTKYLNTTFSLTTPPSSSFLHFRLTDRIPLPISQLSHACWYSTQNFKAVFGNSCCYKSYIYVSVSLTLKNLKCTNVGIPLTTPVHSGLYEK